MWTPRRILLLLAGLAAFTAAFLGYTLLLGGVDGLPELPPELLAVDTADGPVHFSNADESPTITRLKEAFGPGSPEVTDSVAYKTKLELRDRGLVFACGQPAFSPEPSKFVTVAPFSLAFFGKPRPAHLRAAGEASEISTFHADKAVLEFDRPVASPQEALSGKVKLVGIELASTPDVPSPDPRKGKILVTNNQRSTDASQFLVFRTPGPLFYRNPDEVPGQPKPAADAPQVWTAAAVEVIDRKNLPRPLRSDAPPAVPSRPDDLRGRNAVANILMGVTLPPPTITAEGMKLYLTTQDDKPGVKKNGTGYTGVRRIDLVEKVQMNLWTDGAAGLPGGDTAPKPLAAASDPPAAAAAAAGGLADAAAIARRLKEKSLLVIETLGPFRYDFEAALARFEAAPVTNPAVSNHVTASRLMATGAQDNLFAKVLVVEFATAGKGGGAPPPEPTAAAGPVPAGPAQGMRVKGLTATGEHVFIAVESEQLLAQGTELKYTVAPDGKGSLTALKGAPVVAVRERNRMQGGDAKTPAEVLITSTDAPAGSPRTGKRSAIRVLGPGRVDLYDAASNDNTTQAAWGTSLTQERQVVGGQEQDLLKFEGGGSFTDAKGGMRLAADRLWLWLGADPHRATGRPGAPAANPQRLVATGNVDGKSAELMIRKTDQLTVWFREAPQSDPLPAPSSPPLQTTKPAAAPVIVPVAASEPVPATDLPPKPGERPAGQKPPEKPKNPMYLSARVVESWVVRGAALDPSEEPKPGSSGSPAGVRGTKYELERARCEDRVMVHQDPEDPLKSERGVDIFGNRLNLDHSRAGSVLTVHGQDAGWAQVYFEDVSLFGPVVVIDQPNNLVSVDGKGRLIMGSNADMAGNASNRPTDLDIRWADQMRFFGAKAMAEFMGQVQAVQQPRADAKPRPAEPAPAPRIKPAGFPDTDPVAGAPGGPDTSWTRSVVLSHRLDVTFDRPIYFNQYRRPGVLGATDPVPDPQAEAGKPKDKPKLRSARCTPMPDDMISQVRAPEVPIRNVVFFEEVLGPGGRVVRGQRVTAKQLDVLNDERVQTMLASGPGEVRILQLGNKEATRVTDSDAPKTDTEMKLTIARFQSRLVAKDTAKVFQEATFDDGAKVIQIPSADLNASVVEYALPPRGVFLECARTLKVSTSKARKDGPAQQSMEANGNARFLTDDYEGTAARITYDGQSTILAGGEKGLAKLFRRQNGPNSQDHQSAERIVYNNRTGAVSVSGSSGAEFTGGP